MLDNYRLVNSFILPPQKTNIRAIQRQIKLESRPVYVVMLEMLATTMRKIYTICDETIRTNGFSRALLNTKVNRLLDILREYKPEVVEKKENDYNNRNDQNYVSWYKAGFGKSTFLDMNVTLVIGFEKISLYLCDRQKFRFVLDL